MAKVLIINTGGTFNKVYHPINGELEVDSNGKAIREIMSKWQCEFEVIEIIGKDSLEMTGQDRLELLATISQSQASQIIVIHGTDTMNITAEYLHDAELEKSIILTGAMIPYSIDPVEATANFSSAYGYISAGYKRGVFIAMHGIIDTFDKVTKDRSAGRFKSDT